MILALKFAFNGSPFPSTSLVSVLAQLLVLETYDMITMVHLVDFN